MAGAALASVCLLSSPTWGQAGNHGAGVNWSGSHGGVNWDGGHRYEGGGHGGYSAAAPPPAYLPRLPSSDAPPTRRVVFPFLLFPNDDAGRTNRGSRPRLPPPVAHEDSDPGHQRGRVAVIALTDQDSDFDPAT